MRLCTIMEFQLCIFIHTCMIQGPPLILALHKQQMLQLTWCRLTCNIYYQHDYQTKSWRLSWSIWPLNTCLQRMHTSQSSGALWTYITIVNPTTIMFTYPTKSDRGCPLCSNPTPFKVLVLCTTTLVLVINPSFILLLQILSYCLTNGYRYLRLLYLEVIGIIFLPLFSVATRSFPITPSPLISLSQVIILPKLSESITISAAEGYPPVSYNEYACNMRHIFLVFTHKSWPPLSWGA